MARLSRGGLTLVELLITMAIMAIIAAAVMGTARAAMESARRSRTQTLVTRISNLITEQLATYSTRRIDVNPLIVTALDNWVATAPSGQRQDRLIARGQMMADARLLAVRELIKLEMPDEWQDIAPYVNPAEQPLVLSGVPSLTRTYLRRYNAAQAAANRKAELLYLVVMNATGDGEARTQFSAQDIGDVDNDGAPEFLDGWRQPIRWIRWPAGLVSDLQPFLPDGTRGDHDPFDPYRRDLFDPAKPPTPSLNVYPPPLRQVYLKNIRERLTGPAPPVRKSAFKLTPLIYSLGPDATPANRFKKDPIEHLTSLDPYILLDDGFQVGEIAPKDREFAADNITNHLMEY